MNKKLLLILSVVFLLACTVGGTVAYLVTSTPSVTNTFVPGEVDGEITEDFDGTVKKDIQVKNSGTVDAYMRVKLVSYWYAPDTDAIIAKDLWWNESTWALEADNGWFYANGYFYYPEAIEPDDSTEVLFTEEIQLKTDVVGNRQVLEILAEAIQANPADAVEGAWTDVKVGTEGETKGQLIPAPATNG